MNLLTYWDIPDFYKRIIVFFYNISKRKIFPNHLFLFMPKKGYLNPPVLIKQKGLAQTDQNWSEVHSIPETVPYI